MSIFGDYKSYKKYEPMYSSWKLERDVLDAKRLEYLRQNPDKFNKDDVQRGRALLRAVDIMDEYSQKRAEDMEVATSTAVGYGLQAATFGGAAIGMIVAQLKPIKNFLAKHLGKTKQAQVKGQLIPTGIGMLIGSIAAFPLCAWAAKAEVSASRRGRFEAMRKELDNPNSFAVLTDEQTAEAQKIAKTIKLPKDKKVDLGLGFEAYTALKELAKDGKTYKAQKKQFDLELAEAEEHLHDEMTPQEIENAKKDQQLLTKIIEKIDIASQDYAENTELATSIFNLILFSMGSLVSLGFNKALKVLNIKVSNKTAMFTSISSMALPIIFSFAYAQIQKQASRVGRFKVKQEMMKDPAKLVYVADEDASAIKNAKFESLKKDNYFSFLLKVWKDNKEYNKYKKSAGKQEEKFYKAIQQLELTPEQRKNAVSLQKNTFRTFNKIDENSQKYAESVEALADAISYPIGMIFALIGAGFASKYIIRAATSKSTLDKTQNFCKYTAAIVASLIPQFIVNIIGTREQKKASRIADMITIKELNDYRNFR